MNNKINTAIRHILARGYNLKDVETSYKFLISIGDEGIPHIVSALRVCSDGNGEGRWWDGADKLCQLLSELKTESAKGALLIILKTDSKIVEFDRVRHQAAEELTTFNDPKVITDLLVASKTPHAPILSIKKAIEALGGEMPLDPQVILSEVSNMPMEERIEHFRNYRSIVEQWPNFQRRSYYWWIGIGVANSGGGEAAFPFFAASLEADPSPDAAAWTRFNNATPSPQTAHELAKKYPLPNSIDKSSKPALKSVAARRLRVSQLGIIAVAAIFICLAINFIGYLLGSPAATFRLYQYSLLSQNSTIRALVLTLADPSVSVGDRGWAATTLSHVSSNWKNSEGYRAAIKDLIAGITERKVLYDQKEWIQHNRIIERIGGFREIGSLAEVFTPVLLTAMKHGWRDEVIATVVEVGKASAPLLIETLSVYDANSLLADANNHLNTVDLAEAQDKRSLAFEAAGKELVPSLLTALQDKRPLVRRNAIDILSRIGANAAEAIPALTAALKDENADVSLNAAIALPSILSNAGDEAPGIREAIKDLGDYNIKRNAVVKASVARR